LTGTLATITFLTPAAGVLAAAALLPAAAFVVAAGRVRRVVATLRLPPRRGGVDVVALVAVALVVVLLGLAAAQPALARDVSQRERLDAEALFVVDVSGSMAASAAAGSPTRLDRAISTAERLRSAIPQVPSGVATLTDRVLPDLLPVGDTSAFAGTLDRAVGIEQPPAEAEAVTATDFASLTDIAGGNFFAPTARRRIVVLLTDGESASYDPTAVARAFARSPRVRLISVHIWGADEAIHLPDGGVDPGYRPDPGSGLVLRGLAAATGGSTYDESQLGGAAAALRRLAGTGPTRPTTIIRREAVPLGPYIALCSLLPLAFAAARRARRFRD
jgi:hypothetical protein